MRTPSSLGLGQADPFLRATDIVGAYISLHNATYRDGQFGPEVVFTAELLADFWDATGNAVPARFRFSQSCEGASEARMAYVEAFATSREPIGPFVVVQLDAASDGVSGAIVLNDASEMLEGQAIEAPKVTSAGPGALARAAANVAVRNGAPARTKASPRGRSAAGVARPAVDDDELEDLPF